MRVDRVTSIKDALRQEVFYAGTHLAKYNPTALKNRAKVKTVVENGIFERFLEKRQAFSKSEDLLQRLNYITGVHYSRANQLTSIDDSNME